MKTNLDRFFVYVPMGDELEECLACEGSGISWVHEVGFEEPCEECDGLGHVEGQTDDV